jgi:hypothetical protein
MVQDDSLEEADRRVSERTRQECPEEMHLLERGLTIHMRALGFLGEHTRWESDSDVLRVVLMTRCFNSLHLAYRALASGYHTQALLLLRSALEDWLAEQYLNTRPQEAPRWILPDHHRPKRSTLLKAVGSPTREKVVTMFNRLDEFAHPGRLGVWQITEPTTSGHYARLGGHADARWLELVVYPFLFVVSLSHNALFAVQTQTGHQPAERWVTDANDFDRDATEWIDRFNRRFEEKSTAPGD